MQQVNSLWIGTNFSLLEILTMKSFVDHGFEFHLWVYNHKLKDICPNGVTIRDANEILPEKKIFTYDGGGDCRGGSLGGFSDLFRYYLIHKIGGIYVDMDVTCLTNFNLDNEYGFRPHSLVGAVANIIKAPAGCSFLERCISLTEAAINKTNTEWVKPVKIFADVVKEFNFEKFIFPKEYFGNDSSKDVLNYKTQNFFLIKPTLPNYGIHWCRECSYGTWSYNDIYNWNYPKPLSLYYNLLTKHKLISQ
jgi:hypothetical protein